VIRLTVVTAPQQEQQETNQPDEKHKLPRPALETNVTQHPTDKSQLKNRKKPQENIEPKPAGVSWPLAAQQAHETIDYPGHEKSTHHKDPQYD
jgi:hypothetical protein